MKRCLIFAVIFFLSLSLFATEKSSDTINLSESKNQNQPNDINLSESENTNQSTDINLSETENTNQPNDINLSETENTNQSNDINLSESESEIEKKEKPEKISFAKNSILNEEISCKEEVEKWKKDYLRPERTKLLRSILENSLEYRLYVRKLVQEKELPCELEYLPVIESGYKTAAKSKSGALGMWQFMENSVKPFLVLNEYIDERLDPWKSTQAGLAKLVDNYKIFGDWFLAIGAYNCGVGAMSKAIKKGDSTDFWYLAENGFLPAQTKDYVPKLLAVTELATNADFYEIDLPDHSEEFELLVTERDALFDYIEVNKAYSITELAREMRIDEKTLKKLNPALTKGFTPPASKYEIRVPNGLLDSAKTALTIIKPIEFPFQYKVISGDSLWSISRKFGTTVQALCDTNGIEENAILKIGKILYIPSK